jgi:SAM-dependent methyltransferase
LDVGTGIGEFLRHAGKFFDVVGTEISDEAIRLARNRFGIAILKGTLAEPLKLEPGSFDAVSLIHVLEHVSDPVDTIARCRRLLRPGGWLFVAVPNDSPTGWYRRHWGGSRTLRRVTRRNAPKISYRETPPFDSVDVRVADTTAEIHLSHFSPECLRDFLSRSGFDVVYMGPDPCYTTTGFRRVKDGLDFRFWGLLYALFGRYCYQTVCFVARARR